VFRAYALGAANLNLEARTNAEDLIEAINSHILATGTLSGTYQRQ
jgi:phosphatidylethanolamine-binding protein (PEBP) family uncharacterized protein